MTAIADPLAESGGEDTRDRQFATTLARGLDILLSYRVGETLLGNKDFAIRTGLSKPTVARLTHTLTELGYPNADVPIFLAHGTADPVIQIARAVASRDALTALGYAVEWHAYAMPHSVCAEEVADMNRWLLKVLART